MYFIKSEKNLINVIKFGIIIPILFFSFLLSYLLVEQKNAQLKKEVSKLKEDFIKDKKRVVKNEVQRVIQDIKYETEISNQLLKNFLKDKVYEAYQIATNIYNEESKKVVNNQVSKNKITNSIKNALSGMIYDEGKGYIFMDDINGVKLLQPLNKSLEGKNFLDYKDAKGYSFTKKIVKTIADKSEAFDTYYWYKHKEDKTAYQKLSFYKYFEPLNVIIGTGKYIDEYKDNIQKRMLARINKIRFDTTGYVFIFNTKGTYLSHYKEENLGKNALEIKDSNGKYFIKDFINLVKEKNSAFSSYNSTLAPNENIINSKKISYIEYYEEWDWIIGSGFYLDELEIAIKEKVLNLKMEHELIVNKIFVISFIVILLLSFISVYISQLVSNIFLKYKKDILKEQIKYKKFLENSSDAIFIVDLDGFIFEYSKQFKNILGFNEKELSKLHVSDFEVMYDKKRIIKIIENIEEKPLQFETKYKKKDGTIFEVSLNIVKVRIDEKSYFYTSFRDITQSKELQKRIIEQKVEFQTIFDYSQDGIAIVDFDLKFLKTNKAFRKITGYTIEELTNTTCHELTSAEDREKNLIAVEETIITGHALNIEKSCFVKNRRIDVNMSISLLPDKKRLLISLKDISTLKIIEEQTKLASMGEMIGNIAHQWRQPLSIITTSISGLKLKAEYFEVNKDDIYNCADDITKQANYLSNTIDNFRNFLKVEKRYLEVNLCEIINNSISLLESSLNNNYINIILDLEDDLEIFCNKNEISEAIINIINNSKDALVNNIKVEKDRLIFISTKKINKESIKLLIYDSGMGIDENIIEKIFIPYFTTKHQSQGTGLGLSMVDKIIRQRYNNILNVYNKRFKYDEKDYCGACFEIIFSKKL